MDGGVALAFGREGDFGDARKARELGSVMPNLRAATISAPSVGSPCTASAPRCSRAPRRWRAPRAQRLRDGIARAATLGELGLAVDGELALGDVAAAADLDQRAGRWRSRARSSRCGSACRSCRSRSRSRRRASRPPAACARWRWPPPCAARRGSGPRSRSPAAPRGWRRPRAPRRTGTG